MKPSQRKQATRSLSANEVTRGRGRANKSILILGLCAMLGACAGVAEHDDSLGGKNFTTTKDGVKITLNFAADQPRAYGKVINNYNSMYEVNGDTIVFKGVMSTKMMGLGDSMRVEDEYFKFLTDGNAKTYNLSGRTLILKDTDGKEMKFDIAK